MVLPDAKEWLTELEYNLATQNRGEHQKTDVLVVLISDECFPKSSH